MKPSSQSFEVKINHSLQSFIAIVLLVIGLLIEITRHGAWVEAIAGICISLSIAIQVWYLLQSSKKLPMQVTGEVIQLKQRTIQASELGRIILWARTRTIYLVKPGKKLALYQLRTDEANFTKLSTVLEKFAKNHQLAFDIRKK